MEIKCDVLVVGAGPAGLATAITTSKAGLKTIILERSSEIGYPVKTSAFTWRETWEDWNLPENVIYQKQDSFYINSANSNRDVEVNFGRIIGGTLNYHIFLRELAFVAIKNKSKLLLSERALRPICDGDFVTGVETSQKNCITSKIVIDCSGHDAVIARKLGLITGLNKETGIGMEYEMKCVRVRNPKAIDFYVGKNEVVPVGYGWIFPVSSDAARVGVSMVYNTPDEIENKNIRKWLDHFIGPDSIIYNQVKDSQPYEIHIGGYPLSGMIEKPYGNGVLVVGDAASHASMLLGEGIRYAMNFGKLAGNVAIKAVEKGDYSVDFLISYRTACMKYLGENYAVAMDLLQVPTDEYWEGVIDGISQFREKKKTDLILKYLKTAIGYQEARELFPNFVGRYLRKA